MNRRSFLAACGGVIAAAWAGCSEPGGSADDGPIDRSAGDDSKEDGSVERGSDGGTAEDDVRRTDAEVRVYLAVEVPADATILDAEADGLAADPRLAEVLSRAAEDYEEGIESEFGPDAHLSPRTRLAAIERSRAEIRDVETLLGHDGRTYDGHDGCAWYVAYEGTTYVLELAASNVCDRDAP